MNKFMVLALLCVLMMSCKENTLTEQTKIITDKEIVIRDVQIIEESYKKGELKLYRSNEFAEAYDDIAVAQRVSDTISIPDVNNPGSYIDSVIYSNFDINSAIRIEYLGAFNKAGELKKYVDYNIIYRVIENGEEKEPKEKYFVKPEDINALLLPK